MTPRGGRRPYAGRPRVQEGRVGVTISFAPALAAALKAHAADLGITVSQIVTVATHDYLVAAGAIEGEPSDDQDADT